MGTGVFDSSAMSRLKLDRMNIDDLRLFLAVARTQSMTKAGADLGIAKSVVSRRLGDLEHQLGVRLFTRSTRTMGLTADGSKLLQRAPRVLQELDALREDLGDARRQVAGPLRITAPTSFGEAWLGPVLFDFVRRYPEVDLRVELSDRTTDLVGEGFDLAIRVGEAASSDLVARPLGLSRRAIVASPALLRQLTLPADADDVVQRLPAVAYTNRCVHREWRVRGAQGVRSLQPNFRFWADSGAMALQAAIHGIGMTITPTFLAAAPVAAGALKVIRLANAEPEPDALFALRAGGRPPSLRLRTLIDHLAAAFEGTPPWDAQLSAREASVSSPVSEQTVREHELLSEEAGT